ncbi:hypothetical protein MN608_09251 [Microdochium nivale]|nr:hypothetical protein MN608_09251 [Microdochium nivale]
MSNLTLPDFKCEGPNALPEFEALLLPLDRNLFMVPNSEVTLIAMADCIAPDRPNIAEMCYLWCEITPAMLNRTAGNVDNAAMSLSSCLRSRKADNVIAGWHKSAAPSTSAKGVLAMGLAIGVVASALTGGLL